MLWRIEVSSTLSALLYELEAVTWKFLADIPCGALIVQEMPCAVVPFDDLNMHFCDHCLLWLDEKKSASFCERCAFALFPSQSGGY